MTEQLFQKVSLFYNEHPKLVDDVVKITTRMDVIAKIYDNIPYFRKVNRSGCIVLDDITRALVDFEDVQNSVLIHFAELGLYGMFTNEQYLKFIDNLKEVIELDGIAVNLYQIVFVGEKQKLVFMCANAGCFERLQKYARDCFQANVSTSANEITVAVNANNEADVGDKYNTLHAYIQKYGDAECGSAMGYIPIYGMNRYRHRKYSCNDTLTARTMEELITMLKTSSAPITITINGNINNGTVNGNMNNKIKTEGGAKKLAEDWIDNNLPVVDERTSHYYTRYTTSVENAIANNQFNGLVTARGYKTVQGTNGRYWKKV